MALIDRVKTPPEWTRNGATEAMNNNAKAAGYRAHGHRTSARSPSLSLLHCLGMLPLRQTARRAGRASSRIQRERRQDAIGRATQQQGRQDG